jgi:hypothetical protein
MKIKLYRRFMIAAWAALFFGAFVSCTPAAEEPIPLASFTENYVEVSIVLEQNTSGNHILSATFTPPEGYHLYSKDIPITGIEGLGRPTRIALTSNSLMKSGGGLLESVKATAPEFEPRELLVYPLGAVTLRLPVELPPGADWMEDEISVTYMACSASQCKPPVVGKIMTIRVPCADALDRK